MKAEHNHFISRTRKTKMARWRDHDVPNHVTGEAWGACPVVDWAMGPWQGSRVLGGWTWPPGFADLAKSCLEIPSGILKPWVGATAGVSGCQRVDSPLSDNFFSSSLEGTPPVCSFNKTFLPRSSPSLFSLGPGAHLCLLDPLQSMENICWILSNPSSPSYGSLPS